MSETQLAAWNLEMQRVHHRLEDELRVARHASAKSMRGDLLTHCYAFCAALSTHHTGEDNALFPKLLIDHPELEPVVRRLEADHQVLADLIARFERALQAGPASDLQGNSLLTCSILDELHAQMTQHFAYEERILDQALDDLKVSRSEVGTMLGECSPKSSR